LGDKITFGDSLVVTLFSMSVVFLGLIILAVIISFLKSMSIDRKIKGTEIEVPIAPKEASEEDLPDMLDDKELVAVIAAAIAASLGVDIPDINIKTIRRIAQNTPAWAQMGKQERIFGKL